MDNLSRTLRILTGTDPFIPEDTDEIFFIQDRSVTTHRRDKRYLAVEFLEQELIMADIANHRQEWTTLHKFGKKPHPELEGLDEMEIYFCNLIADIPGTDMLDRVIIIGAHYDVQNSLSSCWHGVEDEGYVVTPGADDNGSGAIAALELAKRLSKNPLKNDVKIVFFDGEEPGFFLKSLGQGSHYFVKDNSDMDIRLAFIIDMVGGPVVDPRYGFTMHLNFRVDNELCQKSCKEIGTENDVTVSVIPQGHEMSAVEYTDSAYFSHCPSLLFTNTTGINGVPTFYHTENDTVEIIDWDSFLNSVNICESLLRDDSWY